MTSTFTELGRARYISLTTFRRDGTPVATPVWLAPDGSDLVVTTLLDSGKVKRIRHTPRVTMVPCDMRGRIPAGAPVVEGRATVVAEPEPAAQIQRLVLRRYPVLGRVTTQLSRFRRSAGYIGVRISPTG